MNTEQARRTLLDVRGEIDRVYILGDFTCGSVTATGAAPRAWSTTAASASRSSPNRPAN